MVRTGEQYRDSIRDGREVYVNGEHVKDVLKFLENQNRTQKCRLKK